MLNVTAHNNQLPAGCSAQTQLPTGYDAQYLYVVTCRLRRTIISYLQITPHKTRISAGYGTQQHQCTFVVMFGVEAIQENFNRAGMFNTFSTLIFNI